MATKKIDEKKTLKYAVAFYFCTSMAGHEPRRAEPERAARFDRQHRDVGVHGLQHADLLQLAVHDPAFAVRGRLDRRGVRVADRQVHQAARTEGLARDHGEDRKSTRLNSSH